MKKSEVKEYMRLFSVLHIWCGEVTDMLKKHKEKAWEKCSITQMLDFLSILTDTDSFCLHGQPQKVSPVSRELVDYYRRAFILIELSIIESAVEVAALDYPEWYELVNAAFVASESTKQTDRSKLSAKITKFIRIVDAISRSNFEDEPWVLRDAIKRFQYNSGDIYSICSEEIIVSAEDIISMLAMFKYQKGTPKQRREQAEKEIAGRIRDAVDLPTLKELQAVEKELRALQNSDY